MGRILLTSKSTTPLILAALAVACGSVVSQPELQDRTDRPSRQVESSDSALGNNGIRGRVLSKSDVIGIPDSPLEMRMVIVITQEGLDDLLRDQGHPIDEGTDLSLLGIALPQRELEAEAIAVSLSNSDGEYEMTVPPGSYALCLGEQEEDSARAIYLYGCVVIVVVENVFQEVDVYTQFSQVFLGP